MTTTGITHGPPSVGEMKAALISVDGLAKAFGPTQALRSCSFELLAGEVHALVGENGSGKSTLVKILGGVHAPDAGTMEVCGVAISHLRSPAEAQRQGIATVFQEILTVNPRSVLDNVWLGAGGLVRAPHTKQVLRARAQEVLEEILGREPALDTPVERLSLSDRQACVIARSLVRNPRVLILDEATSALDIATRDRLFEMLRRLTQEGVGVIVISHRMDELSIADRVTVMRSGRTLKTWDEGDVDERELWRLMSGSDELVESRPAGDRTDSPAAAGAVVLRVADLRLRANRAPIDVAINAGEIVGVAGLEGHGQDAFIRALWGLGEIDGQILRREGDRDVSIRSPHDAAAHGIVYVPRERRAESLFPWQSIRENFAMATLGQDRRAGLLSSRGLNRRFSKYIDQLKIVLGDPRDGITTLSGGNQQKVIVARWLATGPRLLLLNDPTRGIDVTAKRDIYALLTQLAADGVAIVMLSTEIEEHLELMDRVLVFREHELFTEYSHSALSRTLLVSSFFGRETSLDA